jgi:CspA family cold shock protein
MYDRERRPGYFRNEEPQSGRRVEAKVKWFNSAKGFGFVTLTDGSPDAFLPMAVLRRAGYDNVGEGAVLVCEIGPGAKGPLVLNVLNVDESQVVAQPRGGGRDNGYSTGGGGASQSLEGAVKWFEPDKGYGFISPDGGGKDVFIHVTALRRSGVNALGAGQRVRVDVVEGRKGLEADRVTLI